MTRVRQLAIGCMVLLMFVLGQGSAVAAAGDDEGTQLSEVGQRAFQQLNLCLRPDDAQLNVLYLLDASSSLKQDTDRGGRRFDILAQDLERLGAMDRDVNVAIASFDLGFDERAAWQRLTPDSASKLTKMVTAKPSWWGAGNGTNWEAALRQGDAMMRQAPEFDGSCNMVVWLTDGGINVEGTWSNVAENAAAMREICATDPASGEASGTAAIVDSMRTSGIHLIGILLQSEAYLDKLEAGDKESQRRRAFEESRQSYMRPIVEGEGSVSTAGFSLGKSANLDYTCGMSPMGEGLAAGALLFGSNPIAMAFQLGSLGGLLDGAQPVELQGDGPFTFNVPIGINFIEAQIAGKAWTIFGPDQQVVLTSSSVPAPGLETTTTGPISRARITGDAVTSGEWTIDVTDKLGDPQVRKAALLDVKHSAGTLRVGELGHVDFSFTDKFTGAPADPSVYKVGPASVSAQTGRLVADLDCRPSAGAVEVNCTFTPGHVGTTTVKAEIEVTTQDPDDPFSWLVPDGFVVQVLPEAVFPYFDPSVVALSDLDGKRGVATGQVTIVGPEEGAGKVCFPASDAVRVEMDVVDRAEGYEYVGPPWGECPSIAEGGSLSFPVSVTNGTPATGSVLASFDVRLESDQTADTRPQTVSLRFDTIRQGTPPWWLLLLLLSLGIAIPLGILYLQGLLASRLAVKGLRQASVPVRVRLRPQGALVVRGPTDKDAGEPLLTLDDWTYMPASLDRPRSVRVSQGVTLSAVVPRGPLSPLRAEARGSEGKRLITGGGSPDAGITGRMGLSPAGEWILVADESELAQVETDDGTFAATLYAFLGATADANETSRDLAADVRASEGLLSLPSLVSAARAVKSSREAGLGSDPVAGEDAPTQPEPTSPIEDLFGDLFGPSDGGGDTSPGKPPRAKPNSVPRPADPEDPFSEI